MFKHNQVFERGSFLHATLEHYPNKDFKFKFHFKELEEQKDQLVNLVYSKVNENSRLQKTLNNRVKAEQQFFLDFDLKVIKNKTNCLFNGYIDHIEYDQENSEIILIDWKSGKTRGHSSLKQLHDYSLWVFEAFKNINTVRLMLWYIEQDDPIVETVIYRDSLNKNQLLDRIDTIEKTENFEINKSENCKWCDYIDICNPTKSKIKMKL